MRYFLLFGLALILTGCLANNALTYDSHAITNQYHLARVRKGMSEKQVLQIMHKPYSYETFQVEDDIYDVWFYVTKPTGLDQSRMVAQNLTPLTFKNGVLVGSGYTWYYYAMKSEAMELEPQKPIPIEHHERNTTEDEAFEKALRAPGKPAKSHLTSPTHGQTPPTQADKAREALHTEAHTHPGHPTPHTHPVHPVKIEPKTPPQHQVKQQTNPKQEQPKKPIENEKLPPNVHIISKSEPLNVITTSQTELMHEEFEFQENTQNEKNQELTKCSGACSLDRCSSNRFQALILGMTETQVYQALGEPKTHETFTEGKDVYDVWFYETYPSKTNRPSIVPQHMTPLTFKNARLVNITDDGFYEIKARVEEHAEMHEALARQGERKSSPPKFIKPYVAAEPPLGVSLKDFGKVHKGMKEDEVSHRLGKAVGIENYSTGHEDYQVRFYQIDSRKKKAPKHLPIIFKDGVVVATDMKTYNKVRKKAGHECIDCYTPAADRMQEDAAEQNFNYW